MSPLIIIARSDSEVCSVSRSGIGMVQAVVKQTRWKIGNMIKVGFIEKAKCILLRSDAKKGGFKLAYANTRTNTGGRIFCQAFIRNYLQTIVELPVSNIIPVFPKGTEWTLALFLDNNLEWDREEFSKAGSNKIPKDVVGVYELLGNGDAVLRVGEGKIRDRINMHLKDQRFAPPEVKAFRYLVLDDSEDGKIMEQVLISEFEAETGVLPRFQEIRS